jgi:hypothetical protein
MGNKKQKKSRAFAQWNENISLNTHKKNKNSEQNPKGNKKNNNDYLT